MKYAYALLFLSNAGLTKREHLIGMIAQGIVSNPDGWRYPQDYIAKNAIEIADAILEGIENA